MTITLNGTTGIARPLGSAGSPSDVNTSDSTTGLYFPSSNTVGISTGGTNALYIDASQNVGIGTTSPSAKLDLNGTSVLRGNVNITNSSQAIFYNSDSTNQFYINNQGATGSTNAALSFVSSGVAERMRIDSSGNVGIGTSSPASYGLFTVLSGTAGSAKINIMDNSGGSAAPLLQFGVNSSNGFNTSDAARIWTTASASNVANLNFAAYNAGAPSTPQMTLTGGNVGIGTSTPGEFFHLNKSSGDLAIRLQTSAGNCYVVNRSSTSGMEMLNAMNGPVTFYTNNIERMRIDSSGNLLINTTTSPSYAIQTGTTKNGSPNVRWEWGPSIVNASYYVTPAGGGSGVYINSGNTSWSSNSDETLKNITGTIQNGLEKVATLRAAEFTWKSDENNKPQVGLIAQDVQKVLPEVIDENADGHLGVRYTEVIPLLVAAIQELKAELDALKGTK